jgi:hypothetical protein
MTLCAFMTLLTAMTLLYKSLEVMIFAVFQGIPHPPGRGLECCHPSPRLNPYLLLLSPFTTRPLSLVGSKKSNLLYLHYR